MSPRAARLLLLRLVVIGCLLYAARAPAGEPPQGPPAAPASPDAELIERAEAAIKARDWKNAEPACREWVRRSPASARPHRCLGMALLGLEKPDDAIAEFERSIVVEDYPTARYNLGIAYGQKGDFAKAADAFRLAVKLTPDYPQAWSHLVDALARSKRDMDAYEAVTQARAKCPKCGPGSDFTRSVRPLALYFHGKAARLFEQGNLDLAEVGEKMVLSVDPDLADAHYNLGKIATARGNPALAEASYRKAIASYRPQETELAADAKNNLAYLLAGRRGSKEAVSLVREAIAVRGDRPSYLDTLGRACDGVDDRPCAREAYSKLLRVAAPGVPGEVVAHAKARLAQLESTTP